ncbi:hypothetical protein RF11_00019 [Thelohanellus kitauei]|uniref:Uncharacterized protein n=1 Tax=Thelohanellus kitauei TaxID=669202 RepID=A0A0C2NCM0_THEKT|nr:hypothetical protein RF11_00019 [Thelohanellus kitauei]
MDPKNNESVKSKLGCLPEPRIHSQKLPSENKNKQIANEINEMDTPTLRIQVRKYGIKPMGKSKMRAILQEISEQTSSNVCNEKTSNPIPKPVRPKSNNDISDDELKNKIALNDKLFEQIITFNVCIL